MLMTISIFGLDAAALFEQVFIVGYFAAWTLVCMVGAILLSALLFSRSLVRSVMDTSWQAWAGWMAVLSFLGGTWFLFVMLPDAVGIGWYDGVDRLWQDFAGLPPQGIL